MGLLSGLFENETLKKTAFNMLKKHMVENNCRFIVVKLNDYDEFELQTFEDVAQPVVMSAKALNQLMEMALEQEKAIKELQDEKRLLLNLASAPQDDLGGIPNNLKNQQEDGDNHSDLASEQ
jgi:hypothetical protein